MATYSFRKSQDEGWDWDILLEGHFVTHFNGGWNAASHLIHDLSLARNQWFADEISESVETIKKILQQMAEEKNT